MNPPVLHLPLDLTGEAVTNKVTAELHLIAASGNRAVVTQRGPFFTKNLVVRNANTGQVLVPDVDYRPVHMFLEASLRATLEICSVVLVLPACAATEIEIDYQAIGAEYSASVSSIEQMLESLDLDSRTVHWGDLIGAPEYFPPTAHLHDIGDLYGFEYVVAALESVRRAILLGDQAAFDELRRYIDTQDNHLRGLIQSGQDQIEDHINRTDNPHNTTKAHVGLGNVANYGVATQSQAEGGAANNVYMTPLRTREAITAAVGTAFNAHVGNLNNPHQVSKAQVGLGSVENLGLASLAQAQAGSGHVYMTATRTGEAIAALAVSPLNAHKNDKSNPHGVTKSQVGLGNVDNYGTATVSQATTGTASNLFMTPANTREAIDARIGNDARAHFNRTDNPHQVTKSQVGLGSVNNYATATNAQAQAGTATNLYMTPANTRAAVESMVGDISSHVGRTDNPHNVTKSQVGLGSVDNARQVRAGTSHTYTINWTGSEARLLIDSTNMGRIHTTSQPDPNIAAHANRSDNPHSVTKSQIGLGSVSNYGIASQSQAEAGTANNLYMTPLRTKQAITSQAVNPLTSLINQRVVINSNGSLNTLTLNSSAYLYTGTGGMFGIRVNGNRYWTFETNGNLNVQNGRVIASGGFQPSDRRFKSNVRAAKARAMWRESTFVEYFDNKLGEDSRGLIAQELLAVAPDRVLTFDHTQEDGTTVERYAVDYLGIALENSFAAGEEIDGLKTELEEQRQKVEALTQQMSQMCRLLDQLTSKS